MADDKPLVGDALDDHDLVSEDGTTMPHQLLSFGRKLEVNAIVFEREREKRQRAVEAKTAEVSSAWRAVVKRWREDSNASLGESGGDGTPHRIQFPNWSNRDDPVDAHWGW